MKALLGLLAFLLLGACSRFVPPAAPTIPAPTIPASPAAPRVYDLPVRWTFFENQPAERVDQDVELSLSVNDKPAAASTVSLKDGQALQTIRVPEGVNELHAQVVGRAAVRLAIAGKPGQSLALWLYRDASKPPPPGSAAPPLALLYELRDDSPAAPPDTLEAVAKESLPLVCTFYRDDVPTVARGDEEVPLRIFIDDRQVFDGIARNGTAAYNGFLFRVPRGIHNLRVEAPGRARQTAAIDAQEPLWIKIHYTAGPAPAMRLLISNSMLGAF